MIILVIVLALYSIQAQDLDNMKHIQELLADKHELVQNLVGLMYGQFVCMRVCACRMSFA